MCGQLLLVLLQYFLHFAWTIWYQPWLFWSKLFSWVFEDCCEAHSRKNTLYPHWALSLCYLSLQQPKPVMGETVAAPTAVTAGTVTLLCGCFHGSGTPPGRHFIPPSAATRLITTSQTGCHPQAFSQLLEGVLMDTAPQHFLTADKMGKLI